MEDLKAVETASTKGALFKSLKNGISFVNEADKRVSNISFEVKKFYMVLVQIVIIQLIFIMKTTNTALTINTHELKIKSSNLSFAKYYSLLRGSKLQVEWDAIEDEYTQYL